MERQKRMISFDVAKRVYCNSSLVLCTVVYYDVEEGIMGLEGGRTTENWSYFRKLYTIIFDDYAMFCRKVKKKMKTKINKKEQAI